MKECAAVYYCSRKNAVKEKEIKLLRGEVKFNNKVTGVPPGVTRCTLLLTADCRQQSPYGSYQYVLRKGTVLMVND